jgi:ATP-dependent Clp protease adaptor protein ClpS
MGTSVTRPRTETVTRTERPKVYKVILLNDDYTPREFVVGVLGAVFGMSEDQAHGVMLTAHMKGCCVVAVYTRDTAETKATQAIELAARQGFPLMFTTEPED